MTGTCWNYLSRVSISLQFSSTCCPSLISYKLLQKSTSQQHQFKRFLAKTDYFHSVKLVSLIFIDAKCLFSDDIAFSMILSFGQQDLQLIQNQMNQESLDIVIETLQTFIALKQQNYLIQGWIQLKKNSKTNPNANSRTYTSSKPYTNHYSTKKLEHLNLKQQNSYHQQDSPSLSPRSYAKYQRMPTQYSQHRVGQGLFETFNQNKSAHWNTAPLAQNSIQHLRNHTTYLDQQSPQLDDSEQFQDIVLDRLSKLEKSVNEMMREKKVKQTLRGYVGAPIQHNKRMDDFLQEDYQLPTFVEPPSNLPSDRYQEQQVYSPKRRENKGYQSWETSPVGKPKEQINYNLKYIPLPSEPSPVNLTKIRKILEEKSHKGSSIGSSRARSDHIEYAYKTKNQNEIHREVHPQKKIDQAYVYQLKGQFHPHPQKQPITNKKSQQLYNRYGFSNTTKNQTPQQNYSRNLEMQSVTESRNRFTRSPKSSTTNNVVYPKAQIKQTQVKITYPGRISGASSSSGHSYFSTPAWRQERVHY